MTLESKCYRKAFWQEQHPLGSREAFHRWRSQGDVPRQRQRLLLGLADLAALTLTSLRVAAKLAMHILVPLCLGGSG